MDAPERLETQCCIVGGGPAGMMLGFSLARAGVPVVVLEKHRDFFRDFRGDTIHPSTLELMRELGLLTEFLQLPHQKVRQVRAHFGAETLELADFSHLPTTCPFVALMPQWDFLNFLAEHAKRFPTFSLRMESEATDLLWSGDTVTGVTAKTPAGTLEVRAKLVIGADGRSSIIRKCAGLKVQEFGAPIDVLWFRLSKKKGDPEQSFGHVGTGQFMVLLDRGDYWQCAYVIRKGSFPERQQRGLDSFRTEVSGCAEFVVNRMDELKEWDQIKLLTVKVDRLCCWHRDGLLCLGDSAHAMSPIGGVGINLAIQDAVAAANQLARKLIAGAVSSSELAAVQRRRELPTRLTQGLQIFLHRHFLERVFASHERIQPPWIIRLLSSTSLLRRLPARLIGLGFRPEHLAG